VASGRPMSPRVKASGAHLRRRGPLADLRDTPRLMTEESTTPDLVELTRTFYETMDRDWDFDALAGFFAPDAVWDLSESHLGIYEGVAAIGDFLVGYWATWRITTTRSRRSSTSATACCLSRSGKTVARGAAMPAFRQGICRCSSGRSARSFG
jgi:hypothetical protein